MQMKIFKRLLLKGACHFFYYAGVLFGEAFTYSRIGKGYKVYNWLMVMSSEINSKHKLGIWGHYNRK